MEVTKINIPEFDEYLGLGRYIPHYFKLKICKDDKKFFINSTLNCLTNIKSFLEYLFYFNDLILLITLIL